MRKLIMSLDEIGDLRGTKSFWYLCSPYTKYKAGLDQAYRDVVAVQAKLMAGEVRVYSPIIACHDMAHGHAMPTHYEFWRDMNHFFIDFSHGLLIACLDGWQESAGVTGEIAYAEQIGKPIIHLEL